MWKTPSLAPVDVVSVAVSDNGRIVVAGWVPHTAGCVLGLICPVW